MATSDYSQSTPNLNNLSDELLLSVAEYTNSHSNRNCIKSSCFCNNDHDSRALLNLSLTSRRVFKIAEQVLYSQLHEVSDYPDVKQHVRKFLCRILERPDLAKRVKLYHASAGRLCDRDEEDAYQANLLNVSAITDEQWGMIRKAAEDVVGTEDDSTEYLNGWIKDIENGDWDALTALLLYHLPNLEELEIEEFSNKSENDFPHLARFLSSGPKQPPVSTESHESQQGSKLKSVSLSYYDTEMGFDLSTFLPFLKITTLRRFSAAMIAEGDVFDSDDPFPIQESETPEWLLELPKSNLTHLTLGQACITSSELAHFLRRFPKLESLEYSQGGATVGNALLQPPLFMQCLMHLKDSLKSLIIIDNEGEDYGDDDYSDYAIGSFSSFTALKSLCISTKILLGDEEIEGDADGPYPAHQSLVEALPPNIENLTIDQPNSAIMTALFELLDNIHAFPFLRKLELGWKRIFYPDKPNTMEPTKHEGFLKGEATDFLKLCGDANVEVIITPIPPPDKFATSRSGGPQNPISTWAFSYPYDGWEEHCEKNNLDPKTGNDWEEWGGGGPVESSDQDDEEGEEMDSDMD